MIFHDIDQNGKDWARKRSSIPTASNGSKIITSSGKPSESIKKYAAILAENLYSSVPIEHWSGNSSTEYGHEHEPLAAKWYENNYFCDLSNGGFVTDDDETYGASPDRFVSDNKLLEIKCLPKSHTEILMFYKKNNKAPSQYFVQPQFQMLACECDTTDLLFYHPSLPKLVITIKRDQLFIEKLKQQIKIAIQFRNDIFQVLKSYK